MRPYGVQAVTSTEGDVRGALADAAAEAGRSGRPFGVGAAADGSLAVAEHARGPAGGAGSAEGLSLVACTAGPGGGFHRPGMRGMRGIDEAAAVASDCLARGIMGYGSLGPMGEGRNQLYRAISDAEHTIRHLGGWYVLGRARGEAGIMLAPAPMSGRFVAPRSLYVGPLGAWTVSRVHSCRFAMRARPGGGRRPAGDAQGAPGEGRGGKAGREAPLPGRRGGGEMAGAAGRGEAAGRRASGPAARPAGGRQAGAPGHARLPRFSIMHRLYMANGYGTVDHGRLGPDAHMRLLHLENAIEDTAALVADDHGGRGAVRVDVGGRIEASGGMLGHAPAGAASGDVIGGPQGCMLVVVDPKGLRHDGTDAEFAAAVRGAARRADGACYARLGLRAGGPRSSG